MIKEIFIERFKSITIKEPIELKNFSILCGSNSSGKSSFIQAILMFCQTFSSRYRQDSISLNGHLVRLGAFGDIKDHNSNEDNIKLGFTIDVNRSSFMSDSFKTIKCEFVFGRRSKNARAPEEDYHPGIISASIKVIHDIDGVREIEEIAVVQNEGAIEESINNSSSLYAVNLFCSLEQDDISKEFPEFEITGCEKSGLIPSTLHIKYNYTRKISTYIIGLITGNSAKRRSLLIDDIDESQIPIPKTFFLKLREYIELERQEMLSSFKIPEKLMRMVQSTPDLKAMGLREIKKHLVDASLDIDPEIIDDSLLLSDDVTLGDWLLFINKINSKQRKSLIELIDKRRLDLQAAWYNGRLKIEWRTAKYTLRSFSMLSNYLAFYFSRSVKYLGPLRNEPEAIYASLGHIDPTSVGLKGEYTAATLHINRNKRIKYPSPLASHDNKFLYNEKEASLQEACKEWLSYLGVISDFHTRDKGKLGYEIYVKTEGQEKWQDLTHVGVGVSQVLPIVLMFLISAPGDVLIFEQPELHLHPKIQSRLCDFFCAMTELGRQCLVETHSEYLVNRLRLRIAQSRDEYLEHNSSVFFIKKSDGQSIFENIKINRYGSIISWPKDFFDQTDTEIENILIEATKRKNWERKGGWDADCSNKL